jgi:iron complex outermembrane receptor protein
VPSAASCRRSITASRAWPAPGSAGGPSCGSAARHAALSALGGAEGVLGVQAERSRFVASGEEAFVPATASRNAAVFLLEAWRAGPLAASLGWRREQARVRSEGDAAGADEARFGPPRTRSFSPGSAAASLGFHPTADFSVQAGFSATRRAPTYYELFANGLHVATGAFEVGDADLGLERSRHTELGFSARLAGWRLQAQVFRSDFGRFIALDATGAAVEIEDSKTKTAARCAACPSSPFAACARACAGPSCQPSAPDRRGAGAASSG